MLKGMNSEIRIKINGVISDITERKKNEERLRASEEKYRSLVDNSDMGIAMISPEMQVLSANRQMKEWFPAVTESGNNICYKTFNNPPRKEPCTYCPVKETLQDGMKHESITDTPTPDGIRNYKIVASPILDEDGNVISVIESVEDFTEWHKAELRIRESEEKFRSYIDNAPDGIFVADEKGYYIDVNEAAAKITGYSRDELIGMHISDMVPDNSKENAIAHFKSQMKNNKIPIECLFVRKDGTQGWWSVDTAPLSENRFLGFVSDITETKRLRELEVRASRLETAGTIAGQVAHDFNNLLAPIVAYPDFISESLPPDHKAQNYLRDIEKAAKKIADINQDLLTMGRRGHYNLDVLNLNQVVMHAVNQMKKPIRNNNVRS